MPFRPARSPLAARLLAVFGLLLCLVWHPWAMAIEAQALGTIEVCTALGMKRFTAQGEPVDGADAHEQDCCCPAAVALPPQPFVAPLLPLAAEAPAARLSAGVLSIEWRCALSRGPPAHA